MNSKLSSNLGPESPDDFEQIKSKSVSGFLIGLSEGGFTYVIKLIATMIMARFIDPADFGLIAMLATVMVFADLFKDMGLNLATIHRQTIDHEQLSNLFWINTFIGIGIGLLLAWSGNLLAWFYHEERLKIISITMAFIYPVAGLGVQPQALMIRQMRFGRMASIRIVTNLASSLAGIILAILGMGCWALVWMQIVYICLLTLLYFSFCGWWPALPRPNRNMYGLLSFGGNLTIFNFFNYFSRNMDNILIGRIHGSWQLGLYSKAYSLLMLPLSQITQPIGAVAIPALCRLQDRPDEYARYYYRTVATIALLTMPTVAFVAALSHEIVWIVLGPEWIASADIFKVLALAALFQPVLATTGWVFVSLGQTRRMALWGFCSMLLIVLSFYIGVYWQAIGVAWSYLICNIIILVPILSYSFKCSPIKIGVWFRQIRHLLIMSILIFILSQMIHSWLTGRIVLIMCLAGFGSASIVLLGMWICKELRDVFWGTGRQIRDRFKNKSIFGLAVNSSESHGCVKDSK